MVGGAGFKPPARAVVVLRYPTPIALSAGLRRD